MKAFSRTKITLNSDLETLKIYCFFFSNNFFIIEFYLTDIEVYIYCNINFIKLTVKNNSSKMSVN